MNQRILHKNINKKNSSREAVDKSFPAMHS